MVIPGTQAALAQITPDIALPINDLKTGGYIIYFRHGEATVGQDTDNLVFEDCSTQRNLSDQGRTQAQIVGNFFKKNSIPVAYPVIASPYCRTRESAEIAFGKQNVQLNPMLADIVKLSNESLSEDQEQPILTNVNKLLETVPALGKNTIIVDHSFPAGLSLGPIPYMGAVIIKPKGNNKGYDVIKRVSFEEFTM
ncbi:hypothetical protein PBAT_15080 [Paenibacillus antarcticus]|uniref:Histidine phosphatase family protein n=2 Tax=Paenibacillus antarcticus TaxID=253703 RepID=A0A168MPY4_9BACL|nr:hypothetical protein PBAT_15080 [Paenibacillus antarcticus]